MSVIRDLSHLKKNVVLELFGTSKKRVEQKENILSPSNRPSKKFCYPQSSQQSKLFSMLTPSIPLRSIKKNTKNNESTTNENITRKKQLHISIEEPRIYARQSSSQFRDFRSQISFDEVVPQTLPRKISQPQQFLPQQSSVRRSSSFRDLFKSQIKFG